MDHVPDAEVAARHLDHLTTADVRLLAAVAGMPPDELAHRPVALVATIALPQTAARVLPGAGRRAPSDLVVASPFLVFAVALHGVARELLRTSHIAEWTGPGQRLPVFVDARLRTFAADPAAQLFLAELLASYAHVMSGSYLVRTGLGWRRRRWSELDPTGLVGLLGAVPADQRPGIYRRLGDLALFLTGVFPDYTAKHAFGPVQVHRLLRSVEDGTDDAGMSPVTLLERLGTQWYRLAAETAAVQTRQLDIVRTIAERFTTARQVLLVLTERYLAPAGNPWFSHPPLGRAG